MGNSNKKIRKSMTCSNLLKKKNDEKKNIGMRFRGKYYNVICDNDESFSSAIEGFKKRAGIEDLENLYFYSERKNLNSEMKLNQISSTNSIEVDVHEKGIVNGGMLPLNFTDISKGITEEHYFSSTAPSYRTVTQGINIYGICRGKKCKAYKKEVIVPQRKKKSFDLIKEKDNLECPECGGVIIPKTLGFHLCKYKIFGKKYLNNIESFEVKGEAGNKNSIQYYSPDKNGEAIFFEFKIEVEYL